MKWIIILVCCLLVLLAGCSIELKPLEEQDNENSTLFIHSANETDYSPTFVASNFLLGTANVTVNTDTPFIFIDCDWILNKEFVRWDNLNMSLNKGNESIEIDLEKLCNNLMRDLE